MDFKKIFTSKTGVAIVFVAITILAILGFSVICKRGGSYMFKDSRGTINNEVKAEYKDVIDVNDGKNGKYLSVVFSSNYNKNVDATFKYNSYKYHIVVDKDSNTIMVDDKNVFTAINKISYVYLVEDILVIQETDSFVHDNLYFVDMDGNKINVINDIAHNMVLVTNTNIKYFVEKCDYSESDIYKPCSADSYIITYLGDGKLSESTVDDQVSYGSTDITDCEMDLCTMYDKDNLKIEYYSARNEKRFNPAIVVNGNYIKWSEGYRLSGVEFTYDKYLYIKIESGTGNGLLSEILIADLSGNVITTIDEKSLTDIHMYNYFSSFEDGKIVYDAVQESSSVELVCKKMLGINEFDTPIVIKSYGDIAYVKNEYQYIGNGQVSKINHSEKTFGNYMQELTGYDNCQDAINNIDSWKSKDDIYKFYGVK